jgi:hypothetical protein
LKIIHRERRNGFRLRIDAIRICRSTKLRRHVVLRRYSPLGSCQVSQVEAIFGTLLRP